MNGTIAQVVDARCFAFGQTLFAVSGPASIEAEWVRRAQGGDVAAFGRLFETHHRRIYALCLRMTSDPDKAADLTQDTFVRAWEKLGSFRGESRFLTWLHRMAVNLVIGDFRSRRKWEAAEIDVEGFPGEVRSAVEGDPGAALDLERAVGTLPPQARTIFVLHDVEGYKHREIAEITGLAEGTSKAHLHRARRLLREVLSG